MDEHKVSKLVDENGIKINLLFFHSPIDYWQKLDEKVKTKLLKEYQTEYEINVKINLLFHLNHQEYWEKLDKSMKTKLLKEYRTEEEIKDKKLPTKKDCLQKLV